MVIEWLSDEGKWKRPVDHFWAYNLLPAIFGFITFSARKRREIRPRDLLRFRLITFGFSSLAPTTTP